MRIRNGGVAATALAALMLAACGDSGTPAPGAGEPPAAAASARFAAGDALQPGDRYIGNPDAPVVLIEYASLTCGHCAAFHVLTGPQLKAEYVDTGKLLWVYRDFPLDAVASAGALVAGCTSDYFAFVDLLFQTQRQWLEDPREGLVNAARQAGLTRDETEACIADQSKLDAVRAEQERGVALYEINSTPTLVLNGRVLRGAQSIEQMRTLIDPLLPSSAGAAAVPAPAAAE